MTMFLTYTFDWSVVFKSIPFFERGIAISVRITVLSMIFLDFQPDWSVVTDRWREFAEGAFRKRHFKDHYNRSLP